MVPSPLARAPQVLYNLRSMSSLIVSACGGFLLAVLWMDLMFDVQVLRYPRPTRELPENVLGSIAAYYRRATTDARPMTHLITVVMLIGIATLLVQAFTSDGPRWPAFASLALAGGPIGLAAVRIVPNAIRLGARTDSAQQQTELARSICRDHLLCLASVAAFLAVQLSAATR